MRTNNDQKLIEDHIQNSHKQETKSEQLETIKAHRKKKNGYKNGFNLQLICINP